MKASLLLFAAIFVSTGTALAESKTVFQAEILDRTGVHCPPRSHASTSRYVTLVANDEETARQQFRKVFCQELKAGRAGESATCLELLPDRNGFGGGMYWMSPAEPDRVMFLSAKLVKRVDPDVNSILDDWTQEDLGETCSLN